MNAIICERYGTLEEQPAPATEEIPAKVAVTAVSIDCEVSLDDVVAAHRYVDAAHKRGNVILNRQDRE